MLPVGVRVRVLRCAFPTDAASFGHVLFAPPVGSPEAPLNGASRGREGMDELLWGRLLSMRNMSYGRKDG